MIKAFENKEAINQDLYSLFSDLLQACGGDPSQVTRVYAVNNPRLRRGFEGYRESIQEKHHDTPGLFKRSDWKLASYPEDRRKILLNLNRKIASFRRHDWNDGSKVSSSTLSTPVRLKLKQNKTKN